ncbi:hypothetical protein ACLMJK_006215 [Lecanora helva]
MAEKRRTSTRYRGEPPLKKRALSPPSTPAVSTAAAAPPPSHHHPPPREPPHNGLPTNWKEGQPLPTQPAMQDEDVCSKSYQTIAESGVLAASLEQSRRKWLVDGIFDRYWWKVKKKDMVNRLPPPKETMTKLGVCSMIIDPHVFEVTLYTIKELPSDFHMLPVKPPSLSAPQYNPFSQNQSATSSSFNAPPPQPPGPHPLPQSHGHPPQPSLPPFREGFGSFGLQGPSPVYHPPVRTQTPLQAPTAAPSPNPPFHSMTNYQTQEEFSAVGGEAKADPVIQMLANRAANDDHLKDLMKVVASGKASPDQLREFQDHIDELNTMLKSHPETLPSLAEEGRTEKLPNQPAYPRSTPHQSSPTDASWTHATAGPVRSFEHNTLPPIKSEPVSKPYPASEHPSVAKPPNQNKGDICGICFDFGGSGDRYTIPRFSILEYLYGGTQVIISFIVIRQGNLASSGNYKANMSYYQPVTLCLSTPQPRILEPLARVVAPAEEVRNYMNNYFDRLSPAESVHLATRLPRIAEHDDGGKPETPAPSAAPMIQPVYAPPNSMMPLTA